MNTRVKTSYYANFNIPRACVACSGTPGAGLDGKPYEYKVSGSQSNWSGKRTTTLNVVMPLCTPCYESSRVKGWAKFISVIGVLGALALACTTFSSLGGDDPTWFVISGGSVLVWIGLFVWLYKFINEKDLSADQKERRKKVMKCARIISFKAPGVFDKTGSIVFDFQNADFAGKFSAMNLGQMS